VASYCCSKILSTPLFDFPSLSSFLSLSLFLSVYPPPHKYTAVVEISERFHNVFFFFLSKSMILLFPINFNRVLNFYFFKP
jgi:hypothetical protein